jgi:transposase
LSEEQRRAAVALFDGGCGSDAAARRLGVSRRAIRRLHDRWSVHGAETLVAKATKRIFSFELKREVVARFQAGETKLALAKEFDLSSPKLVEGWARIQRAQGDDGLRPKPRGRP